MKVICIDASGTPCSDPRPLIEGDAYTVVEGVCPTNYLVIELNYNYLKKRFIPVSEISETTFERNYKTQTV